VLSPRLVTRARPLRRPRFIFTIATKRTFLSCNHMNVKRIVKDMTSIDLSPFFLLYVYLHSFLTPSFYPKSYRSRAFSFNGKTPARLLYQMFRLLPLFLDPSLPRAPFLLWQKRLFKETPMFRRVVFDFPSFFFECPCVDPSPLFPVRRGFLRNSGLVFFAQRTSSFAEVHDYFFSSPVFFSLAIHAQHPSQRTD